MQLDHDRQTDYSLGDLLAIPVAVGTRIYSGSLVSTGESGYAQPASCQGGPQTFEGVATAQADNRAGPDGGVSVIVRRRGRYLLDFDPDIPLTQGLQGSRVFVLDDHTVTLPRWDDDAGGDRPGHTYVLVGRIDKIEDPSKHTVWVSIDQAVARGQLKYWDRPGTADVRAVPTAETPLE